MPTPYQKKMLDRIKAMFGVERVLFWDYETFSECDLKAHGADVYAEHPSTEAFLGAWAFDNEDVSVWDQYATQMGDFDIPDEPPQEFLDALEDPTVLKVAWNATFEYVITRRVIKIDIPKDQIIDAMVAAFYLSFPGGLGKVGKLVGLPEDKQKDKDGKRLIRKFCVPAKPLKRQPDRTRIWPWDAPEDWLAFRDYNAQDVSTMRDVVYRLFEYPMPIHEWRNWQIDLQINQRGIPVNHAMAVAACDMYDDYQYENTEKLRQITGLENPNSRNQMLDWLKGTGEYVFDNLTKAAIANTMREDRLRPTTPHVLEAIRLRSELSKTSATKFRRFRDCMSSDNTIKGALQFGGAQRTLRWSGRLIQPQNLKKPRDAIAEQMPFMAEVVESGSRELIEALHGDAMGVLSECVRGTIQAPPGQIIVDADLSAIENVVLGWSSGDEKILEVFRTGNDPYISFAQYMYDTDYDTLFHEYKVLKVKKKRTICKPAVLGCGYRLGAGHRYIDDRTGEEEATGLIGYAKAMYIDLSDEEAKQSVDIWRATYRDAVAFWYDLERAAMECLRTGRRVDVGPVSFDVKGVFLRLRLPSGRHLHYYKAHIRKVMPPWGKTQSDMIDNVAYYGLKESKWCLQTTHGGKFTENICQAIARDILQHGINLAMQNNLDVFLHVHDQICALTMKEDAERDLALLEQCMQDRPSWALDIPLSTGGFATTHFSKD